MGSEMCIRDRSIVEERSILVEGGNIPRTVMDVLTSVMRYHNPMGRYPTKRIEWMNGLNVKVYPDVTKADVLYFDVSLSHIRIGFNV